jgi:predicted small secreted protein
MKKTLIALALMATAFTASAFTVTSGAGVDINVLPSTAELGELTLTSMEHAGAPVMTLTVNNPGGGTTTARVGGIFANFVGSFDEDSEFVAYCIEIFTRASNFGEPADMESYAAVSPEVAKLFAYSASMNSNAVNDAGFGGAGVTDNAWQSAGLQLALWELLYDDTPGNLSTGKFTATGGGTNGGLARNWGNSLLGSYSIFVGTTPSLTVFTDIEVGNKGFQDFIAVSNNFGVPCEQDNSEACLITEVPEPGSLALAGLGLLGAGVVSRRRKTAAKA